MMGQDNITWTGARAPGVERCRSLAWRCSTEQVDSDTERRPHAAAESTKGGGKPDLPTGMLGASLTEADQGRPYLTGQLWSRTEGKPAVRNLRGDDGKEQPTRPQSSGVQVPAPPIACLRAVSISDGRDQLTLVCSAGDRPARAKVRSLVVWMAGRRERKFSEVLKAHRQGLPWGDHESPGRNNSKRRCSLENARSEGRAHHRRAKVAWDAEI